MSWYEKHPRVDQIVKEAGMKRTLIWLSLIALLDITVVFPLVNKLGLEIREVRERMSSPEGQEAMEQAREIIEHKDSDPQAAQIYERVTQDISKAKSEVLPETPELPPVDSQLEGLRKGVIAVEGADSDFVGPAGDTGVMQILPSTWEDMNRRFFDGKYPYAKFAKNPVVNKLVGTRYLQYLRDWAGKYKDQWRASEEFLIFAAYNGGIGNLRKSRFDPEVLREFKPTVFDYATRACNIAGFDYGF